MKKTITIEIKDNVGVNVFYENDETPRKHWKDCTLLESVEIYAASRVLAAGTEFTAAYVASGMHRTVEELAGTIKHYNEIMDKVNKHERRGKKKARC